MHSRQALPQGQLLASWTSALKPGDFVYLLNGNAECLCHSYRQFNEFERLYLGRKFQFLDFSHLGLISRGLWPIAVRGPPAAPAIDKERLSWCQSHLRNLPAHR